MLRVFEVLQDQPVLLAGQVVLEQPARLVRLDPSAERELPAQHQPLKRDRPIPLLRAHRR